MLLTTVTALPVSALVAALATPLTQLLFLGRAPAPGAAELVASMAYGMAFATLPFTMRDVLMRAIIALHDVATPFQASMLALVTKVLFGWLVIVKMGLGPVAIPLGAVVSNLSSLALVTWRLGAHVPGLLAPERVGQVAVHVARLVAAAVACTWSSQAAYAGLTQHWPASLASQVSTRPPARVCVCVTV